MAELAYGVAVNILEKLGSFAYEEVSLAVGMKKDLKKLHDKTFLLQSVLGDAEKKQARDERLQMWLVRVKDVFNDAVDVLDEFECEMLRRQVVKEYGRAGRKVSRFFSPANPITLRLSIAHKVKEIRGRLDEIAGDMAQFQLIATLLNVNEEHVPLSGRMRQPFVKVSEVIGRDDEKAAILNMLLSKDGDDLSVIPIVGIGGLGKTTLAQSVFEDAKLNEKFDMKLWVCVSLEFDVIRLKKEILKEIKIEGDLSNLSIQQLHNSLRGNLQGKKFLLVLDDVWNEDRYKWLELRELLVVGTKGSKVIVTTRSTSVSSVMTRTPPYELKGLSKESSMSLLFTHAFGDEKLAEQYPRLKDIGKEIARKCHNVPLALKTLGSQLYSKDEAEWKRVRDHDIWELERVDGRILPALRLSYNTMSPCLKHCFASCSMFPDGATMKQIELISIWMALGILHSPGEDMELEFIAEMQLKELRARCFIQYGEADDEHVVEQPDFGVLSNYKMHDLVHDLACSVTNHECCIIKSDRQILSNRVRHLRISLSENNITFIETCERLWSLHFDDKSTYKITEFFLSTCITRLRYLRLFDLKNLSFKVFPSSIGNLKHLRYLNLSGNKEIKRLPDSVCQLQSLQTLLLGGCVELEELPKDIQRLISLRTLVVTTKQMEFPENGIGCLKSLRTLIIKQSENLRSLPYDLKHCTTLRTLVLTSCGELNLAREYDDTTVELSLQKILIVGLPELTGLPQWMKGASGALKVLIIRYCKSLAVLPEWLPKSTELHTLIICHCKGLVNLPNGIQQLASLAHLEIEHNEELQLASGIDEIVMPLILQRVIISKLPQTRALPQWLNGASNTLKDLKINDCPNLIELPGRMSHFLSLEKLAIENCEDLVVFPEGMECLTSLVSLAVSNCRKLELASRSNEVVQLSLQTFEINLLPETTSIPKWLQGASSMLRNFVVSNCPKLAALPERMSSFSSLEKIVIRNCGELLVLPEGVGCLTSLKSLVISDCRKLELASESDEVVQLSLQHFEITLLPQTTSIPKWLQGASSALKNFEVRNCPKLVTLPEWLPIFSSLNRITITRCYHLSSLPKSMPHLTSLTSLEIRSCEWLELASESSEIVHLSLQSFKMDYLPKTTTLPQWLQGAAHTLKTMHIRNCPQLAALPEWLVKLTSLENLVIENCPKLLSFPEGMSGLTSLTHLEVYYPCLAFFERYQPQMGGEWSAISHVPNFSIVHGTKEGEY